MRAGGVEWGRCNGDSVAEVFTDLDVEVHEPELSGVTSDLRKWRTELWLTIRRGRRGASPSNILQ